MLIRPAEGTAVGKAITGMGVVFNRCLFMRRPEYTVTQSSSGIPLKVHVYLPRSGTLLEPRHQALPERIKRMVDYPLAGNALQDSLE